MAFNSFGNVFRFTTWGESHGDSIGCVIDGTPSGLELSAADIQVYLDQRRPGVSPFTTGRNEPDVVHILSGVYEGKTTGAPISMIIRNQDHRSKDYDNVVQNFRPGHADYVYRKKYGVYDYRGGGRASARETAMRVASGAVARKILGNKVEIKGAVVQIGIYKIDRKNFDLQEVNNNYLRCPNKEMVAVWTEYLRKIHEDGDSVGAVAEVHISGIPLGWGEPIYQKLEAMLGGAIMSINAVKSFEVGCGWQCARMKGSEYVDEMFADDGGLVTFSSNNSGGIVAGISTGEPIVLRFAVKPTSSIRKNVQTINSAGQNVLLSVSGRHDVCIGIRAVPVAEAMAACVLADSYLMCNKAIY